MKPKTLVSARRSSPFTASGDAREATGNLSSRRSREESSPLVKRYRRDIAGVGSAG